MLPQEENELLSRVGPGTPMGELMRQYWVPAGLSSELPGPDCDPVRIKRLCEELIAFRGTDGKVGLVDNYCPHRRASMFFGRNEECGLRCVYHGWKFDVNGDCVDMPSEPAESNFKDKVKIKAYPVEERGGIMWTYMGPRESAPPLPDLEPTMVDGTRINIFMRECNWMQALEGDIDTVHVSFLHSNLPRPDDKDSGDWTRIQRDSKAAKFAVADTDFGTMYGAYRPAEEDTYYWRIANFLFPFYTMTPTGVLGKEIRVRAWVPIDDTHTFGLGIGRRVQLAPTPPGGRGVGESEQIPNGTGWLDRFRLVADSTNDYLLDREQQKNLTYSGLPSITLDDQAVTTSMGAIEDRTKERLGTSDSMIIKTRRRLINAARDMREGITPPGVDNPEVYGVRSGGVVLPRDTDDWVEATRELRTAWVHHPELDNAVPD